jgi:hypothetical protein
MADERPATIGRVTFAPEPAELAEHRPVAGRVALALAFAAWVVFGWRWAR